MSWADALTAAADAMGGVPAAQVGAFAGPLVEVEALVCLKELLNSLGSSSTSSTAAGGQSADLRAAYLLNPTLAGIEAADALLMVGTNPRVEAPLLNSRLRRMVLHADVPVGVVGPKAELTYEYAHLGEGADALSALAAGSSPFNEVPGSGLGLGLGLGLAQRPRRRQLPLVPKPFNEVPKDAKRP